MFLTVILPDNHIGDTNINQTQLSLPRDLTAYHFDFFFRRYPLTPLRLKLFCSPVTVTR